MVFKTYIYEIFSYKNNYEIILKNSSKKLIKLHKSPYLSNAINNNGT